MDALSCILTYIQLCLYGIAYYFTVLLLSHNRPTIYLDNFNVVSNSLTNNATIYLDLRIENENSLIGIYYEDPLNLTITYLPPTKSSGSNVTIGQCVIRGFYQGSEEVKQIQLSVVVQDLFSTTEQRRRLGSAKVIDFVVDLEANIKFMLFENTKSHLMIRSGVEVNDNTGTSVLKTIQMKYASGSNKWGVVKWLMTVPLSLLFHFVFYCACWLAFRFFSFVFLCPSN
ncbi:unnamed protein product [Lactuca saligna]|uniref:Late embryogenesis abundant protein LEA-2 subgroup domain-containing protein n=1 Tax=Lactuca saligna TaxID=75948 RepID=A0AA36ECT0_LACSI|nr:unnamed protein product [Lactuca saligna]